MRIVEVNNGFCRAPFECEFVPRSTFSSHFVDTTGVEPPPGEFWGYNYATKTFIPPPRTEDGEIDYAAAHMLLSKWNDVRNHRNIRLMESDWSQMPDSPLSWMEKRAWKRYRQALRDLPNTHVGNPMFVQFPPRPDHITGPTLMAAVIRYFRSLL